MINMAEMHDVAIIGGSFAGLACAYFLDSAEKIIIEAKKELGAAQTSTCCTSLSLIEKLGCGEAALQKFEHFVLHSPSGREVYVNLPEKFCTIDYALFSRLLAGRLKNAEIKTGKKAKEIKNSKVLCDNEAFEGRAIIDASGWQSIGFGRAENRRLAFGIEIETEFKGDADAFHIFYGKKYIEKGYAWIFPVSENEARVGVGGFGIENPNKALKKFLKEIKLSAETEKAQKHANYIPCVGLRERPEKNVFCVGDALFQVLPLSGEGIRKSMEYAALCAYWVKKMLNNEITLEEAVDNYYNDVYKDKKFYDNLAFAQTIAIYLPEFLRERIITNLSKVKEERLKHVLELYLSSGITQSRAKIIKALLKVAI